jgi:TolB-like protein
MKLLGQADEIKEMTIAIHAWKDASDFDPSQTSKIRTAARALRERLSKYYRTEGQRDPIEVRLPDRGYVPEFQDRRIVITVASLQNMNPNASDPYLCAAVTDDIVYRLNNAGAVEARRMETLDSACVNVRFVLRGCLACRRQDTVKVNAWLQDLTAGLIVWDGDFDEHRDNLLKLSQRVADAVLSVLRYQGESASPVRAEAPQSSPRRRPPGQAQRTIKSRSRAKQTWPDISPLHF